MRLKTKDIFFFITCVMVVTVRGLMLPAQEINDLIAQENQTSLIGMEVRHMKTGTVLYEKNAHLLMKPASLQKIPASLAALLTLGPKHKFVTRIGSNGDDVYVYFTGDPTLRLRDLAILFKKYAQKKGKIVKGNIYVNQIDYPPFPHQDGWAVDSTRFLYGALISNININNNSVCLGITPPRFYGNKPSISYEKDQPSYAVLNSVQSGSCTENNRMQRRDIYFDGHSIHIKGCVPLGSDSFRACLPMTSTEFKGYVQHCLKSALQQTGILFEGQIVFKPFTARQFLPVAVHYSAPLSDLMVPGMKDSKNVIMEGFMVPIAMNKPHEFKKEGALEAFLVNILRGHGLGDYSTARMCDMSGLSHHNLISSSQIGEMLWKASQRLKGFNRWKEAFALYGEDGTLAKRGVLKNKKIRIYAKTGSLLGVSNIAGYVEKEGKPLISFVIMVQNFTKKRSHFSILQDKIIQRLARNL